MATLPTPTLSSVQTDAVALLAAGKSVIATAQHTGVHRATVHNWLKQPEFQAALEEARCDYIAELQSKLREIAELSIDTIRQNLTDPAVPAALKLKAALAVLDRPLFPKPQPEAATESPDAVKPVAAPTAQNLEIARNAPCPCGSGNKYKRCCGRFAPPILGRAA